MPYIAAKFRSIILLVLSTLILTCSFYSNSFNSASETFFKNHQRDSESLILARLIESRNNGIDSEGGFLGRYANKDFINYQYKTYLIQANPSEEYLTYTSSFGLQGYLYYILDSTLNRLTITAPDDRYNILKFLTAVALAATLAGYIAFVAKNFGFLTAIFTLIAITFSQWVVVFSNNLFWVFFLILTPFTATIVRIQRKMQDDNYYTDIYIIGFVCIMIKSLAGYEYISTVLLSLIAPLIFFAIRDRWSLQSFVRRVLILSAAGLSGFMTAVLIHMAKLACVLGSISEATKSLIYTIAKRTHGNASNIEEAYRASLESNAFEVFKLYWEGIAFDLKNIFHFNYSVTFGELVIAIAVISIVNIVAMISSRQKGYPFRRDIATLIMLWFSFLAPISWFFLAKAHSYIHTHMNHILWYVPFLLIGFSYIGHSVSTLSTRAKDYVLTLLTKSANSLSQEK